MAAGEMLYIYIYVYTLCNHLKVPEDTDRHMRKRTLIVTSEDMGAEDTSSDMLLDLESLIEPTPGHNFRKVQTNSDLGDVVREYSSV